MILAEPFVVSRPRLVLYELGSHTDGSTDVYFCIAFDLLISVSLEFN